MNIKQMILMEYFIDDLLNYEKVEKYKIIFEINDNLYTGDFLQQDNSDRDKIIMRYVEKINPVGRPYKEYYIFKTGNQRNMAEELRNEFLKYAECDNKLKYTSLLAIKPKFLKKLNDFVLNINTNEYLNETLCFIPVIYNFTDMKTDKKLDFYLTNSEEIIPVSLLKIK